MRDKNLHAGHRQRLKDKVRTFGLSALNEHEKLELLLTYTIPYKDTNELAHELINRYGSFLRILNAPKDELMTIKGVGEETALFLTTLPEFFKLFTENDKAIILSTTQDCVEYFRKNIKLEMTERTYAVFIDGNNKFIKKVDFGSGEVYYTHIRRDEFSKLLATSNAKRIILYHTHPNGIPTPSEEDYNATKSIVGICSMLGVQLIDHIIISPNSHYSFRANNDLNNIKTDINVKLNQFFPSKN